MQGVLYTVLNIIEEIRSSIHYLGLHIVNTGNCFYLFEICSLANPSVLNTERMREQGTL